MGREEGREVKREEGREVGREEGREGGGREVKREEGREEGGRRGGRREGGGEGGGREGQLVFNTVSRPCAYMHSQSRLMQDYLSLIVTAFPFFLPLSLLPPLSC